LRAVSSCPERDFGNWRMRARRADENFAQRALASEPLRGQLPFRRGDGSRFGSRTDGNRNNGAGGRDGLVINRPGMPGPWQRERPTGAALRKPGHSLDGELRRTRIFNNREPRRPSPSDAGGNMAGGSQGVDSNTGAVERPGRWRRNPTDPNNGGGWNNGNRGNNGDGGNDSSGNNDNGGGNGGGNESNGGSDDTRRAAPWRDRRSRPAPPDQTNPVVPNLNDNPEARRRNRDDGEDPRTRRTNPVRPHIDEPPVERGGEEQPADNNAKPAPVYRPEPRREAPRREEPRREEPRREEPRREEPRREEPRRAEPPAYRPEPRREPPPQRQEPPRQEAPRQEQPRQEAPRQAPPRQEAPRRESPRSDPPQRQRPRGDDPPERR
ncbi:MAG TPA: hypothetical protein VNZ44_05560, partial [Pyrinomonadaceae bacterium]|nr:hypothetical protein [Pyrinomonadaceae bacterium]